ELYVADLDALRGAVPALATYTELHALGFRLWLDAGIRQALDAAPLAEAGIAGLVAGLETLAGPATLHDLCQQYGNERIIFSLDLQGGRPLTTPAAWEVSDAWSIAARAVECGVRRLIVLDLARVGVGGGPGTEDLCRRLTSSFPFLEVVAGGGVRDI